MTATARRHPSGTGRVVRTSQPVVMAAAIGYSLSWIMGLLIFSSSTEVRSSGAKVVHDYTGHQGVVAAQYVLTEGLPAVFLAVIVWALARALGESARGAGRLVLASGVAAAIVSTVQLGLGLWLSIGVVDDHDSDTAGEVFRSINRLDGVKMLLLAVLAVVATRAIRRRELPLPGWLGYVGAALAVTITLSAVGYLALSDTFATAAWLSLPCLLVFVTGSGIGLGRRH